MNFNSHSAYRFSFCPGVTLELIKTLVSKKPAADDCRLCYITTSHSRIYLWFMGGALKLIPYEYSNSAWRQVHRHLWNLVEIPKDLLSSEQKLTEYLEYSMARQFRTSVHGYYEQLPKKEDILALLNEGDTAARLRELRFTFYETAVEDDPEWVGAVEVLCDEGVLVIPYTSEQEYPERDEDKRLIVKYATYVPDSGVQSIGHKFFGLFEWVARLLGNLHWSDLRIKVEGETR